jgi:uncharacterized integral membrane protein
MTPDNNQTPVAMTADANNRARGHSKVGAAWIGLFVFAIITLLLLIFIVQNSASVKIHYLGATGTIGFGVALLLAAVAGSIMTLLIGSLRIVQLKLSSKHHNENN